MSEQTQTAEALDIWAIVELFGHSKIAGRVSERVIAGAAFLQVDVPEIARQRSRWDGVGLETLPAFSRLFNPSAVYGIIPTTEDRARIAAQSFAVRPLGECDIAVVRQIEAAQETRANAAGEFDDEDDGDEY